MVAIFDVLSSIASFIQTFFDIILEFVKFIFFFPRLLYNFFDYIINNLNWLPSSFIFIFGFMLIVIILLRVFGRY